MTQYQLAAAVLAGPAKGGAHQAKGDKNYGNMTRAKQETLSIGRRAALN
jgi:hypothetical protein